MAGAVGFEPTVHGTKNRCLTTWPRPNRAGVFIHGGRGVQEGLWQKLVDCRSCGYRAAMDRADVVILGAGAAGLFCAGSLAGQGLQVVVIDHATAPGEKIRISGGGRCNFTNLATARASQRAREVALRKVLGANRRQLIVQFIGESILVAALAMLIALALVELLLPSFSAFLDADIMLDYLGAGGIALPMIGLVLLVGGLAYFRRAERAFADVV